MIINYNPERLIDIFEFLKPYKISSLSDVDRAPNLLISNNLI